MLWLHFGEKRPAPTQRAPDREVGDYALHVLCPWRISHAGVITGRSDIYVPIDPDLDEMDFRWDRPGQSIVDVQLARWINTHATKPLEVQHIQVDRCAGFSLTLTDDNAFEVFPDAFSMPHAIREQWRLLRPATAEPHFVVSAG